MQPSCKQASAKQASRSRRPWALLALAAVPLSSCGVAAAGPVASFDDIEHWVGVGANRAALVIDWDASTANDASLAWGFRWDGQASGEDLLLRVVNADDRLFLKRSAGGSLGFSTFGIGYDASGDGQFALSDGTQFDAHGVAVTGLPDEDATPVDRADLYREGWFTGVWSYGVAAGTTWNQLSWGQSFTGPHGRALQNGSWDSWAFASPIVLGTFAKNPHAAEPTRAASADFDADGDVDGADLLIWQRGLAATSAGLSQGDANGDAVVDQLDLDIWKRTYGGVMASEAAATGAAVPEAAAAALALGALMVIPAMHRNFRRDHGIKHVEMGSHAVRSGAGDRPSLGGRS
ncbi:MAG: hypothetical protein IT424_11565 [Pirellulales bacterium]|nr:hypothetical protein [Pirellulales bacterium]